MKMITSRTNERIKYVEKLKDKASFRKEEGCFVVEGIRMIREVPGEMRRELFYTESALRDHPELADWCDVTESVSESVMEKLADTKTPQGMVAVVSMQSSGQRYGMVENASDRNPESAVHPNGMAPLYLILDGLQDPGNVGTLIRTAEAVGATAVLLSRSSADPYSPKVVRSTMGTIFRVPVRVCEDLPGAIEDLKKQGVVVYGTHLSGTDFYEADLTGPVALLIGNEGKGLTDEVARTADRLLRIPMEGKVESLNAAISAAVVGYEAYRQRRNG
ncbi:MAG: RNA methyltransferase [Eubacterium sp.]|nr:RNA methyltransferase [Eubacterium sp.]